MIFQARLLPIAALSIPSKLDIAMLFLCIRRSFSTALYLQTKVLLKSWITASRVYLLSLCLLSFCQFRLDKLQDHFWWLNLLTILQKMRDLYIYIKPSCCYYSCVSKLKMLSLSASYKNISIIHEIFQILLLEQYLLGRDGYIRI